MNIVKKIISYFIAKNKNIKLSFDSEVAFRTIKNAGEGCKFIGGVLCSGYVEIGKYTSINGPSTRISAGINKIHIGSFCSIASNVVIQEYYHKFDRITSYYVMKNIFNEQVDSDILSKGSIIIEDDVWIGSNCVILSGVTLGRGSIVGAGSIVTKSIPRYSIVAGNPARQIKKRFDDEVIDLLEKLEWWTWSIDKIKKNKKIFSLSGHDLLNTVSVNSIIEV